MLTDPENNEVTGRDLRRYKIGSCVHTSLSLVQSIVLSDNTCYYGTCGPEGHIHIHGVRSKINTDRGTRYAY